VLDLDHNGTPDFGTVLAAFDTTAPDFFTSNSNGVFHLVDLAVGVGGWALVDLNGDGRLDLVLAAGLGGSAVDVTLHKATAKTLPKCRRGRNPPRATPADASK
jgi:hypothetical protein